MLVRLCSVTTHAARVSSGSAETLTAVSPQPPNHLHRSHKLTARLLAICSELLAILSELLAICIVPIAGNLFRIAGNPLAIVWQSDANVAWPQG